MTKTKTANWGSITYYVTYFRVEGGQSKGIFYKKYCDKGRGGL